MKLQDLPSKRSITSPQDHSLRYQNKKSLPNLPETSSSNSKLPLPNSKKNSHSIQVLARTKICTIMPCNLLLPRTVMLILRNPPNPFINPSNKITIYNLHQTQFVQAEWEILIFAEKCCQKMPKSLVSDYMIAGSQSRKRSKPSDPNKPIFLKDKRKMKWIS